MGETLREIAILVAVFYTLEVFISNKPVPFWLNGAVLAGCIAFLSLGIGLEVADPRWGERRNMPPYYSLLVPAGLALFSAIVGIIALFLERRRARQAEAASGTQSRVAYG